MSKLGNIKDSYGKQIGIAIANTFGDNVLASTILPRNSVIISSPVDADANDIGTYAIFITDNNGTPVRLSYTIKTGNGLNVDVNNSDIIKLSIDGKSLQENNGVLYLSQQNIIDNNSLLVNDNNYIYVNTDNLDIASENNKGIIGIDEYTVKTNQEGKIYVETENLDKANENQVGVVTSDNKTIHIDSNGVININTQNLQYGSSTLPGVIKFDGHTLYTVNNSLAVNTNELTYATETTFGISKCDNSTINVSNGIYSVNTNNLDKCTDTKFGVVKSDGITTIVNNDIMVINNYDNIINKINNIQNRIENIKKQINKLNDSVSDITTFEITDPTIFTFICNSVTSVNLTKPQYGTFPDEFLSETITAEFTVNTNCPFIITVDYLDNIAPTIFLYEINYDDLDKYSGDTGLYNEFQSTNYVDKIIRFSWKCKNYAASNNVESISTRIKITVSYPNNNEVSQTVYYNIIRYNSLYTKNKPEKTILISNSDGKASIDNTITINKKQKIIDTVNIQKIDTTVINRKNNRKQTRL